MKSLAVALLGLIAGLGFASGAQACTDVSLSAPVVRYDFTQAGAVIEQVQLTFSDVCDEGVLPGPRIVEVWFEDRLQNDRPYRSLGGLSLELIEDGKDIVYRPDQPVRDVGQFVYNAANGPVVRELRLRLPGGSADAFSENRQYRMFWRYQGRNGGIRTDSRLVAFNLDVVSAFEARIAGGGRTHTMDFGPLTAAEVGNVNLRFRATDPFQVSMTSQYNGRLRRVSPCGGTPSDAADDTNTVTYTATLNGRPIDLGGAITNNRPDGDRVMTFDNVPFEVQIDPTLDPSQKLAGSYCDVLTLKIGPPL